VGDTEKKNILARAGPRGEKKAEEGNLRRKGEDAVRAFDGDSKTSARATILERRRGETGRHRGSNVMHGEVVSLYAGGVAEAQTPRWGTIK